MKIVCALVVVVPAFGLVHDDHTDEPWPRNGVERWEQHFWHPFSMKEKRA
jgi:hypothetical protein